MDAKPLRYLALIPAACACLWLAISSFTYASAHLNYTRLAAELSFWSRADYTPTEATRQQTLAATDQLIRQHPGYPDYLALAAYAQYWEWYFTGEQAHSDQALALQQQSLARRPALGRAWQTLAEYATTFDNRELAEQAVDSAAALARPARYNTGQ